MTATRPRKNRIVVNLNTLGGKEVDPGSRGDGKILIYDADTDTYYHIYPPYGGILEYLNLLDLPETGQTGIIYFVLNDNRSYRWDSILQTYVSYVTNITFNELQNKPNNIEGYGITDVWTKPQIGDPYTDYVLYFEAALL